LLAKSKERSVKSQQNTEQIREEKVIGIAPGALLLALSGSAEAQQPGKIFRIGFLDSSTASGMAVLLDAFRDELSKLGWIDCWRESPLAV